MCQTFAGFQEECLGGVGGNDANFGLIPLDYVDSSSASGTTAIIELKAGKSAEAIRIAENTLNFTDTMVEGDGGGFTPVATFNSKRFTANNRAFVTSMRGQRFIMIHKDRNGVYKAVGLLNGLSLTAAAYNSGTAGADRNEWVLTLSGAEPDPAYIISKEQYNALLAGELP